MDKQQLIKMIIFFSFTFVVILTLMTVILGIFYTGSGEPAENLTASSDTLAVADSVKQEANAQPDERQKMLDSLQSALAKIQAENRKLQEEVKTTVLKKTSRKPQENRKAKEVAKIYEKMDPVEAAKILSGLKPDLAVAIIAAMKKRQAAKVLAQMEPQLAVTISRKLVQYN